MAVFWQYWVRVRIESRREYALSTRLLTDVEYHDPIARDVAEQQAEQQLRRGQGLAPDTPLERLGWKRRVIDWPPPHAQLV